ncbi:hypothetical protein [Salinisphaera sp. G21_0]|uniref:hypothetical protein n=1 Tax=Salinisphaera sp. G21_0 TaxID=2821094 RepID=UPI001ADC5161|nr:hypothetical protein [Salinisphaera sp. G21_0]MBO9483087.1 hypothetical protein [Salinisphaera sp. G21_0]
MKVVNATNEHFSEFYNTIYQSVCKNISAKVLVIGIASGGLPLMEGLSHFLNSKGVNTISQEIICRRPTTKLKKNNPITSKLFHSILKILPTFILNYLRVIEHNILSKRRVSDIAREIVFNGKMPREQFDAIIVIDDAIDSGYSFKSVFNYITENVKTKNLFTAAFVITQNKPVFEPDFYYIKDVLIRFPWSSDAK